VSIENIERCSISRNYIVMDLCDASESRCARTQEAKLLARGLSFEGSCTVHVGICSRICDLRSGAFLCRGDQGAEVSDSC
jgi:hypothetical protein